jgi:hypothetical protein
MLISELVRCGFTIQYTSTTEIAAVASTAKNTSAKITVSSFVYQRLGYRNSFTIDMMVPQNSRLTLAGLVAPALWSLYLHQNASTRLAHLLLFFAGPVPDLYPIYIGGRT